MVIQYVPGGIRTPDPRLRRALLYPAELLKQERFIIYHKYEKDASTDFINSTNSKTIRHTPLIRGSQAQKYNKKTLICNPRFFLANEAGDGNRTHAISLEG